MAGNAHTQKNECYSRFAGKGLNLDNLVAWGYQRIICIECYVYVRGGAYAKNVVAG